MSIIATGTAVPEFTLTPADGEKFTREDLLGQMSVLVFYPYAFSGVRTEQLSVYQRVLDEVGQRGATLHAISTDHRHSQAAFKEKLGSSVEQLSDFEPKGATASAFGALHPGGWTNRARVVVSPDGIVKWSWEAPALGEFPGTELLFAGLAA